MDFHTEWSPGETFTHLLFPVNYKISASSLSCVCMGLQRATESEKHRVPKAELTL